MRCFPLWILQVVDFPKDNNWRRLNQSTLLLPLPPALSSASTQAGSLVKLYVERLLQQWSGNKNMNICNLCNLCNARRMPRTQLEARKKAERQLEERQTWRTVHISTFKVNVYTKVALTVHQPTQPMQHGVGGNSDSLRRQRVASRG